MEAKVKVALVVAEDALTRFEKPVVMWTGGKDSVLALWYVKSVAESRGMPRLPILFIDHGTHFDETWRLLEDQCRAWGLQSIIARNQDVLSQNPPPGAAVPVKSLSASNQEEVRRTGYTKGTFPYALGNIVANHLLKTVPMNEAIEKNGFDCVITGIRWDEDEARSRERFVSPRTNPPHARVHPILHLSERDVWAETFRLNLPRHPMYIQGYRSLDGKFDSKRVGDRPAWEQDLENVPERAGRAQDKEQIMERLRELGYM